MKISKLCKYELYGTSFFNHIFYFRRDTKTKRTYQISTNKKQDYITITNERETLVVHIYNSNLAEHMKQRIKSYCSCADMESAEKEYTLLKHMCYNLFGI